GRERDGEYQDEISASTNRSANMTDNDEKIAALEREVAALKAKADPPKSDFVPMTDAEHRDWVHQMQERRMSMATPPSVVRDWAVLDDATVKGIALRDAR